MVSESSSNAGEKFVNIVAAIFIAATFIVLSAVTCADAAVKAEGLPQWQEGLADQSLSAVYDNMPTGMSLTYEAEILKTVASRLFAGYEVATYLTADGVIRVKFSPKGEVPNWRVVAAIPQLKDPPREWFANDIGDLREKTELLLADVPAESLRWSDRALQDEVEKLTAERLPGWEPSLLLEIKDSEHILTISFAPQMPMVLAVNPTLVSNSLPTLLHGELREELMGAFVPFIGIPVVWATKHTADMNRWAEDYINNRDIAEQSASTAKAEFVPSQVFQLHVRVESSYYTIGAWAAIYAGTSDESAELGVHIGRKVELLPHLDMEGYVEGRVGLQNWDVDGRFGLRWRAIRDLWVGGEWDSEDSMWWGKLSMDPQLHKPYLWLRVREDGEFNGAAGWRATEYISFELEYDARDEDRWSLKMIGNL